MDAVQKATSDPNLFHFKELLDLDAVQQVACAATYRLSFVHERCFAAWSEQSNFSVLRSFLLQEVRRLPGHKWPPPTQRLSAREAQVANSRLSVCRPEGDATAPSARADTCFSKPDRSCPMKPSKRSCRLVVCESWKTWYEQSHKRA